MNEKEYNELVKKGIKRAQLFSWEKTAKETLSFFDKILGK